MKTTAAASSASAATMPSEPEIRSAWSSLSSSSPNSSSIRKEYQSDHAVPQFSTVTTPIRIEAPSPIASSELNHRPVGGCGGRLGIRWKPPGW